MKRSINIIFILSIYIFRWCVIKNVQEAKSHVQKKNSNIDAKKFRITSTRAFNIASSVEKNMATHIPHIYAIHYTATSGKATTFIMNTLSYKGSGRRLTSTFWK